jgi:hypothetical protein
MSGTCFCDVWLARSSSPSSTRFPLIDIRRRNRSPPWLSALVARTDTGNQIPMPHECQHDAQGPAQIRRGGRPCGHTHSDVTDSHTPGESTRWLRGSGVCPDLVAGDGGFGPVGWPFDFAYRLGCETTRHVGSSPWRAGIGLPDQPPRRRRRPGTGTVPAAPGGARPGGRASPHRCWTRTVARGALGSVMHSAGDLTV